MKVVKILTQRQTKLALSIAAALSVSSPLYAENFEVIQATDNGKGNTENTLSWAIKQANSTPDEDTITLKSDVTLNGVMRAMINSHLTVIGSDKIIDGNHKYRPFFVKSGTVKLVNMTIQNAKAKGGDSQKGGGGAGLGGALFVYAGNVTVENVTFSNNQAIGGNSGANTLGNGGGGMGGNAGGHGGGGLFEGSFHRSGGYGGNGNYGDSDKSHFGVGGFAGGGTGSFGGGGGGLSLGGAGGNGGFGGGGGVGGMGGVGALGGFGGGNTSGGGAGFGGAIFIKAGHLTLNNSFFNQNLAQAGIGTNHGQGKGGAIFVCTNDLQATASSCDATVTTSQVVFCNNNASDALDKENDTVNYFGHIGDGHRLCGPEMAIWGLEQSIDDGDDTPSTLDGTDFGIVNVGSSAIHSFTIKNTGELALKLIDSPSVKVSASSFSVTLQPTSPVDAMIGTTSFDVKFAPTKSGLVADVITIVNDDHDENPYNFSIKGIGHNSAPTVKIATFDIAENAHQDEQVGIVTVNDAESNLKLTGGYTIIDGNTDNVFSISDSGEITLANANALKGGDIYDLTVQATDLGELSDKNTITINVTPVVSSESEGDLEDQDKTESESHLGSEEIVDGNVELDESAEIHEESGDEILSTETSPNDDQNLNPEDTSKQKSDMGEDLNEEAISDVHQDSSNNALNSEEDSNSEYDDSSSHSENAKDEIN